jgi:hypothetical protein
VARAGLNDLTEMGPALDPLKRAAVPILFASLAIALLCVPRLPTLCPMRVMFHVPCPSCGLTRAARLALSGDWAGATRMHPLWLAVLPFSGLVGAAECAAYLRDQRWGRWAELTWVKRIGAGILVALVTLWIARQCGAFGGPVPI